MPALDLTPIEELIAVRKMLHGGKRGAPKVVGNYRVGTAINNSCVLMLSALLQGYVEILFLTISQQLLKRQLDNATAYEKYRDTLRRWGNPSTDNIQSLYLRLGVADILDGISWRNMTNKSVKQKLRDLNVIRNKIAHGQKLPKALSLSDVISFRDFVMQFSYHFAGRVEALQYCPSHLKVH